MSADAAARFVLEVLSDPDYSPTPGAEHLEDLRRRAADAGHSFSDEELLRGSRKIMAALEQSGELPDEELEVVSGGSMFQNFDQKTNQAYNMLAQVIKSMNEMRMSAIRNML